MKKVSETSLCNYIPDITKSPNMAQPGYPQLPQLEGISGGPSRNETAVSSQSKDIFPTESPKDKIMDNAADTQGVHPKTDKVEHQKKVDNTGVHDHGNGSDGGQHKRKDRGESGSKKQREVVNRVLNCPDLDYYKILDIEESAKTDEIRKAFIKLSLLTHPDKSKVPDTAEAFRSKYTFSR